MDLARRSVHAGLRALGVVACAGLLGGCNLLVLDPKGPIGIAEKSILFGALIIMLAIVVPTILATFAFAWWFRATNTRARYWPTWAHSGKIELLVWGVPALTITLLGGVTWIGAHALDPMVPIPSEEKPLEVQVVSMDWKWLFIYPEQNVAAVNQLVIPAGRPVHFSLTSSSVMNAFFIPQLGSMIYTMNGMTSQLHLQADKPGEFAGLSTHFSGDGFPNMAFDVRAVPAAAFSQWAESTRAAGPGLDDAAYAALSQQGSSQKRTFAVAKPDLFARIVSQALPPGPGPAPQPIPGKGK